jgi:hypothetical protein
LTKKALDKYEVMSSKGDSIALLLTIKALIYNCQNQKYRPLAIHNGTQWSYQLSQEKHMTCQAYLEKFQNAVDVLKHRGGSIRQAPRLLTMILEANGIDPVMATTDELIDAKKASQEQYLANAFLVAWDRNR